MKPFSSLLLLSRIALFFPALQRVEADRTSEAGEASITDPTQECAPYNYPPVSSQLHLFPGVWSEASIVQGDSVATSTWNSISSSIPTNISPKNLSESYNSEADPDCWWTASQCVTPKVSGLPPDVAAAPEPSTLGYGFDDGPNCSHNAFYDFLQSQNQKATFYFIGSNVADSPLEAQRALVDGHEICVHTWSHPHMTTLPSENAFAELYYGIQMIKLVVGVTPTCWRPPYGDVDDRIRAIANGLGLQTIMWKYDIQDGDVGVGSVTQDTVDANYQSFIKTAQSGAFDDTGAIVLTHELNNFTMSEAVKFYPQLKSVFQYIVPVGVSLNKTQPYVETNYSLPTFDQYISGTVMTNGTNTLQASTLSSSVSVSSTTSSFVRSSSSLAASSLAASSSATPSTSGISNTTAAKNSAGSSARIPLENFVLSSAWTVLVSGLLRAFL